MPTTVDNPHGLDTVTQVFFYESEFYVLSNFSAFRLRWHGLDFDTSEAAYQWEKFWRPYSEPICQDIQRQILGARSAHEAFKIAETHRSAVRTEWAVIKTVIMAKILRAKTDQHEYVYRKLLETGDRRLIENSWRDAYWGWGPDSQGQNMLGKLWMEIRKELQERRNAEYP